MMRWTIILSLWVLLVSMTVGQFGLSNYKQLSNSRSDLEKLIAELSFRVQSTQYEIDMLTQHESRRLRYLKENFGVVSPGESVFHFGRKSNK